MWFLCFCLFAPEPAMLAGLWIIFSLIKGASHLSRRSFHSFLASLIILGTTASSEGVLQMASGCGPPVSLNVNFSPHSCDQTDKSPAANGSFISLETSR